MGLSLSSADDGSGGTYSRTADAESVVLNFANVLTYSRVLLYTLKEGGEEYQRKMRLSRLSEQRRTLCPERLCPCFRAGT